MKRFIRNITAVMFGAFLLLPTACTNLEEYDASKLADPVALSVVVAQVGDSTIQLTVTNPSDGYVTLGVFEDPGDDLDLDPDAFFRHNFEGVIFKTVKASKNTALTVEFDELIQNTDYVVYGVSSNADGVLGDIVRKSFTTSDSFTPNLLSVTPAIEGDMSLTGELVLEFDEPVLYDSTKVLDYDYYYEGITVENDVLDVKVDGNVVTITVDSLSRPKNGELIFVCWEEGTFTDLSDNPVEALSSGLDDDFYPEGLYFFVESKVFEPVITPSNEDSVSVADMDTIFLTFEEEVEDFHDDYISGGTMSFEDENGDAVTKLLKPSNFIIEGNVVKLVPPMAIASKQTVTLKLKKETFYVGWYNDNAEMEITWFVK